jgi:hypothetical protein
MRKYNTIAGSCISGRKARKSITQREQRGRRSNGELGGLRKEAQRTQRLAEEEKRRKPREERRRRQDSGLKLRTEN